MSFPFFVCMFISALLTITGAVASANGLIEIGIILSVHGTALAIIIAWINRIHRI